MPIECSYFISGDGPCYDDKLPFPMPMDMVSIISAGLINGELKLLLGSFSDDENDRQQDRQ